MAEFILISVSVIAGFLAGLVVSEWSRKTTAKQEEVERKPYACPGCNGTGRVEEWPWDAEGSPKDEGPGAFFRCPACQGKRVLWGK